MYPFGYGLSYTQFEYSDLKISPDKITSGGKIEIQIAVRNIGKLKGDEVVQVYAHAENAPMKVPVNQLKRFERITLAPGESRTLTFNIPASEFSFYSTDTNNFQVQAGSWEIGVGSSSKDIRLKRSLMIE